jgi:hypothetical protein
MVKLPFALVCRDFCCHITMLSNWQCQCSAGIDHVVFIRRSSSCSVYRRVIRHIGTDLWIDDTDIG